MLCADPIKFQSTVLEALPEMKSINTKNVLFKNEERYDILDNDYHSFQQYMKDKLNAKNS